MDEDFAVYVSAAWPRLLRSAWLLTCDWHRAEDLLQTVLAKAHGRWSRISAGSPDAYLRRGGKRMIGPEHLRTVLDDAIPVPPEHLSRAPLSAIRRRIRRRRTATAAVAMGVVVAAAVPVAWLARPAEPMSVPAVHTSSNPSSSPSAARNGPVAPPTAKAGVALAWRTAIVDAEGTTVTLALDVPMSDLYRCRTVTVAHTSGDASEIVFTAYQRVRPGRCDDTDGTLATVRLSSAVGNRVLIDGSDGRSRPVFPIRDLPLPTGVGRVTTTADLVLPVWIVLYNRTAGPTFVFSAKWTQDSDGVPVPGGDHITVPGHTLEIDSDAGSSYSANWVEDGWRITITVDEDAAITRDQFVTMMQGLPWR